MVKLVFYQSKRMSEESITPQSTTDNSFHQEIIYKYGKGNIIFKGMFRTR